MTPLNKAIVRLVCISEFEDKGENMSYYSDI